MQYSEGRLGRIFVLRLDHGEDFLASMKEFVKEKGIESGIALFMGALRDGRMVTGPEEAVIPPTIHIEGFESAWEVFGMATIFPQDGGPGIHVHSTIGRGREVLTGCIRERTPVYLVVEVVLVEILGLDAKRAYDPASGLGLLTLGSLLCR